MKGLIIEDGVVVKYTGNEPVAVIPDGETKADGFLSGIRRMLKNAASPERVTSIGDGAFQDCSELKSVTITNKVTNVGGWEFDGRSRLTSIGDWAFGDCSELTDINIPEGVTSIGDWAFENCTELTDITVPNSVTSIGDEAFRDCRDELTLYVTENSFAKRYAENKHIACKVIGE